MSTQVFTRFFSVMVLLTILADSASAQNKKHKQLKDSKGNIIYTIVEDKPVFPKGDAEMFTYLGTHIKYPEQARKDSVQGTVYVGFVVEKDGSIIDIETKRGVAGGCTEEAIRVIQSMPNWIPGKNKGEAVAVLYVLPIRFKLE